MAWLLKLAGRGAAAALRGGGRLVSQHVIPDSITPWDIRRKTSRASSTLSRSINKQLKARKKKDKEKAKKKATATTPKRGASSKNSFQPSATTRQRFDKNSWSQGRGLQSRDKWDEDLEPRSASGKSSRPRSQAVQKLHDFAKHPGLVIQMKADELVHAVKNMTRRRSSSKY